MHGVIHGKQNIPTSRFGIRLRKDQSEKLFWATRERADLWGRVTIRTG